MYSISCVRFTGTVLVSNFKADESPTTQFPVPLQWVDSYNLLEVSG